MRHNAPQPYEIVWHADGERRRVTTLSEREARRVLAEKRLAGLDPSLYVGNFEIDALTPEQNRRRVAVAQAGENAYQRGMRRYSAGVESSERRRKARS